MTWRKLSDCQWAAAHGVMTFVVVHGPSGYETHELRLQRGRWFKRWLGSHDSLAKAKRRCEAERIMG